MIERKSNAARRGDIRYALAGLFIVLSASPVDSSDHNVAPNTVQRAFDGALSSVVKLYGGGGLGRLHGYGTGFLVSADGKIVTALSILVTRPTIRVVLSDGRKYDARLVRSDEYRQLAVLQIDGEGLPHLNLTKTDSVEPGDTVIAMGNWYKIAEGEEHVSVNRGILSLKTDLSARRLTQDFEYQGPVLIYDAITSNPGAPGGPLLDIHGNCIGIVGRVVEAVNTNTRINYALPSEEITAFLGGEPSPKATTAATTGKQGKPYVGIKISKFGFRHVSAYVQRVRPGSPAAEAGIKPDDLIVAIDNKRITNADAYRAAVDAMRPGQLVRFIIKRGQRVMTFEITIGVRP
ncbi:MAG: S1C family serine protease [Phycisphaerales bacterium]|nr:S1C family serine protease [Phycisphaerales bacterium]